MRLFFRFLFEDVTPKEDDVHRDEQHRQRGERDPRVGQVRRSRISSEPDRRKAQQQQHGQPVAGLCALHRGGSGGCGHERENRLGGLTPQLTCRERAGGTMGEQPENARFRIRRAKSGRIQRKTRR